MKDLNLISAERARQKESQFLDKAYKLAGEWEKNEEDITENFVIVMAFATPYIYRIENRYKRMKMFSVVKQSTFITPIIGNDITKTIWLN